MIGQLLEVRSFYPEQLQGLKEVRFTFFMEALPLSIEELYSDSATKPFFGHVNPTEQMRGIVPVGREVAVNPEELFVPGSENLSFEDQIVEAEKYVNVLRRKLKKGTLDGVNFGVDHASVHAQLDFEYQKRRDRKLIIGERFTRTIDVTTADYGFAGPALALVGRWFTYDSLNIFDFYAHLGRPNIGLILVATPAGSR